MGAHGHGLSLDLRLIRTSMALVVRGWCREVVFCRVRWGVIPPAADMPVAAVASASASETKSGCRVTIAREGFCFFWRKWVYDIPTLPLPASFSSRHCLSTVQLPPLWQKWRSLGVRTLMPEKFVNPRWVVIATSASGVGGLQIVFLGGRGRCLVRNPRRPVTPPSETKFEEVDPRLENNITTLTAAVVVISSSGMDCSW